MKEKIFLHKLRKEFDEFYHMWCNQYDEDKSTMKIFRMIDKQISQISKGVNK